MGIRILVLAILCVGAVACDRHEGKWIADLQVTPPVVRTDHGESVRISFRVRDRRAAAAGFASIAAPRLVSLEAYILADAARPMGTRRRFPWRDPVPGFKLALWDGTFPGWRTRPPIRGTYRVWVRATDERGRTEYASRRIRVLNPTGTTVLPRTQSGLQLRQLEFDGSHVTLRDQAGNTVRARAVSGLRPENPYNPDGIDYTQPHYQWVSDRGPLPAGRYFIRKNTVQVPEIRWGELAYSSGATVEEWGPLRVPLYPIEVGNRSGFFLHLDNDDDGTAGCIGVHPDDEGRFNQIMALIAWMPGDSLEVSVRYPYR